ncbi:MAG TPA: hypothetical protein VHI93_05250, partial [Candidatus Thermoplasmatota archaeon]|nr:hypothetical protein [Candidatus Thermoplasmatota archaeon]
TFVDHGPGVAAAYSVRAFDGSAWGAPAFALYAVGNEVDQWPHCLEVVSVFPSPRINWECILPLPP